MRWPKVSNTSPRRITLPSARQIQTVNYRAVAKGTPGLFDIGLHGRTKKKGKLKFGDFAFCLCSLLPSRGDISPVHTVRMGTSVFLRGLRITSRQPLRRQP